jgi:hypothetical protein
VLSGAAARGLAIALLVCVASGFAGAVAGGPAFDGAAALRHIERLVAIGPRVAGTPGGARARAYIAGELARIQGVQVQT